MPSTIKCYGCGRQVEDLQDHRPYCRGRGKGGKGGKGGGARGKVECYDCHELVEDLRSHRAVCASGNGGRGGGKGGGRGKVECYDCHEQVEDLRSHRGVCPNSRKERSRIARPDDDDEDEDDEAKNPLDKFAGTKDCYFLVDVSGSMASPVVGLGRVSTRLEECKVALTNAAAQLNEDDRISIVTFDDSAYFQLKPRPVGEVRRKGELQDPLKHRRAGRLTALYDSIHLVVSQVRDKTRDTRLLVLTDGEDTCSKHTHQECLDLLALCPKISLVIMEIKTVQEAQQEAKPNPRFVALCEGRGTYTTVVETEIVVRVTTLFSSSSSSSSS